MECPDSYILVTVIADNVDAEGLPRTEFIAATKVLEFHEIVGANGLGGAGQCRVVLDEEFVSPAPWVFTSDASAEHREFIVSETRDEIEALVTEARLEPGTYSLESLRQHRARHAAGYPTEKAISIPQVKMVKRRKPPSLPVGP